MKTKQTKLSTPAAARRVSALLHDGAQTEAGRLELSEWFAQLANAAGLSLEHPQFFARAFRLAASMVEGGRIGRRFDAREARRAYRALEDILERTAAGESLESIRREREAAFKRRAEENRRAELEAPEPEDKFSDEWRYWKLRRLEHALRSGDAEAFADARTEATWFVAQTLARAARGDASGLIAVLPRLISEQQEVERAGGRERRRKGGQR